MSLSFFHYDTIQAKKARRRAFRTRLVRAYAANVANTETVSATANGGQPVTYMIDSGATYTILAQTTADSIGFDDSSPTRQQAVTTVSGETQANVFMVDFKINDTPAFQTEILVMESAFNLLSTEDLAKAYTVTLAPSGSGFHLVPLGQAADDVPTTTTTTTPTTTTTTPKQPMQPSEKTGNAFLDLIRQLYHMFCGMTPKIPFLCNSPTTFMIVLLLTGLVIMILMMKGLFGGR